MKKKPTRRRSQQTSYQTLESRNVLSANPIISLDAGTLTIEGSSGDDTVYVRIAGGEVQATYQTNGSDFQTEYFPESEVTDFRFNGNDGNDHIINRTELPLLAYGNRGNDRLIGGRGNDELHGGPGNDVINGFIGDDSLHGDWGNDIISGWHGNDKLYGWYGDDVMLGGTGDDYISGYLGNDWADGGDGDDWMRGHEGNDHLIGGNGNDKLYGWKGHDHLYGSAGDDYISGYTGSDFIAGAAGDDILKGHEGVDRIFGGDGADKLYGWKGHDILNGMAGNDEVWGGEGNDLLMGEAGNDILHGDTGNDWIHGGDGDDVLVGYYGNDRLVGAAGNDMLCGGYGKDSYGGIEKGDVGYDPDSVFQSEGNIKYDQLLNDKASQYYDRYLQRLLEHSDKVADKTEYVVGSEHAWLPELDFDRDAFDQSLSAGTVLYDQWAAWGIKISTNRPNANPAMVFDSSNPTGGDDDLASPDQAKILIISEDADSSDPDDNARGGTLIFGFDRATSIAELGVLDIDPRETTKIRLYDARGKLIKTVSATGRGDNRQQAIDISADNVSRMEIDLDRSGAVTHVTFHREAHLGENRGGL